MSYVASPWRVPQRMGSLLARGVLSGLFMEQRWDCALRFSHFLYGSSEGWSALRCFLVILWYGMCVCVCACAIVSDRLYLTTMKSRISLMRTFFLLYCCGFSPFLHLRTVGPRFLCFCSDCMGI
ncbi:uncharacterized protein BO88DRAFT_218300 [Aspergillus vadensis CBS 113365]|uniref:Uncharacterized protein n=1 Tax=Aspergillus vadensis (strain CBS 113365 / IMI 142717 / IBT 24658) TaxID=1448311 RepID=A0A319AVA2_ASPVC|nr:hypothetical protein BO88DRAFT_218300 [Aspergillus vadensis CBS 113365]PYH63504.1 hypothetical protein BO88DRAFT_218300 [Aspergillus vadensis CBS 113365]